MPTYDYQCAKCGYTFEMYQSMSEDPLKVFTDPDGCRHLKKGGEVRRLIGTGAGVIFKGSGFYETDYRSKEYREAAKKENEAASPSEKKGKDSSSNGKKKEPSSPSKAGAESSKS